MVNLNFFTVCPDDTENTSVTISAHVGFDGVFTFSWVFSRTCDRGRSSRGEDLP